MKTQILLGFAIIVFTACQKQEQRYTQQSPEIDTYKQVIKDYETQNWESLATHYADSAKILNNVIMKDAQTVPQMIAQNKEDATSFTSWKYDPESVEYEMVVTDKGETWVNFWGHWEANLLANNKTYIIPAHITARFVDGKIVREDGYWDISKLVMDIQAIETAKKMSADSSEMEDN